MSNNDSSKRPTKRQKTTAAAAATPDNGSDGVAQVSISGDALGIVMNFLGPRELFRLACCSKELVQKLTVEMVVKSALIHGGYAYTTIEKLYPLYRNKSIYPSSALRLLRLVNGKRCEFCHKEKVRHARTGFGIFSCSRCFNQLIIVANHPFEALDPFKLLRHKRVASFVSQREGKHTLVPSTNASNKCRTLGQPELFGPLIRFPSASAFRKLHPRNVEEYIKSNVEEAPPDVAFEAFVSAYDNTKDRAQLVHTERYDKREAARDNATESRKEKVKAMVVKLKAMLNPAWREYCLTFSETGRKGREPCIRFTSDPIDNIMYPFIVSPSKMTKRVMQETAFKIDELTERIEEFRQGSFLSTTNPFDIKAKAALQEKYPDARDFFIRDACSVYFHNCIAECPFLMLKTLFVNFGFLFLPDDHDENEKGFFRNIWSHQYEKHTAEEEGSSSEAEHLRKTFASFETTKGRIKANAAEYISWLGSEDEDPKFVEYCKRNVRKYHFYIDDLEKRGFQELRTRCMRYHSIPACLRELYYITESR